MAIGCFYFHILIGLFLGHTIPSFHHHQLQAQPSSLYKFKSLKKECISLERFDEAKALFSASKSTLLSIIYIFGFNLLFCTPSLSALQPLANQHYPAYVVLVPESYFSILLLNYLFLFLKDTDRAKGVASDNVIQQVIIWWNIIQLYIIIKLIDWTIRLYQQIVHFLYGIPYMDCRT